MELLSIDAKTPIRPAAPLEVMNGMTEKIGSERSIFPFRERYILCPSLLNRHIVYIRHCNIYSGIVTSQKVV